MADTAAVGPDWGPLASRIRDEATDSWDDKVAVDRFRELGGHFVRGRGSIRARAGTAPYWQRKRPLAYSFHA
jgi:hypothetical protein